jgi:hypothetical protein
MQLFVRVCVSLLFILEFQYLDFESLRTCFPAGHNTNTWVPLVDPQESKETHNRGYTVIHGVSTTRASSCLLLVAPRDERKGDLERDPYSGSNVTRTRLAAPRATSPWSTEQTPCLQTPVRTRARNADSRIFSVLLLLLQCRTKPCTWWSRAGAAWARSPPERFQVRDHCQKRPNIEAKETF